MEKTKIDRIIDDFRTSLYQEFGVSEDSPTMSSGSGPAGFSGAADPKGPVAGYDPVMKFDGRKKGVKKYINNLLKNREKREKKKQLKKLQNFNPYFNQ